MKEQILKLIRQRDYVTYAELDEMIDGFHEEPEEGVILLEHDDFKNIVYWTNVSATGNKAINELIKEGSIHRVQASLMTYMIDGKCLRMPIVKRARSYQKPHWLPTCFRPGRRPQK